MYPCQMFVITTDQRGSRQHGEQLQPARTLLNDLIEARGLSGVELGFERTVGDEMQALLTSAQSTLTLALHLQRMQHWSVGIGIGQVTTLAGSASASEGPAFYFAREAVERARTRAVTVPIAVAASPPDAAREAESLLQLMAAVLRRRSRAGWEMIDARQRAGTAREAAQRLGITPQAASQRLSAALWDELRRVQPLAARLLEELDEKGTG